jgi:sirohydrochlorin cobaltochelatase
MTELKDIRGHVDAGIVLFAHGSRDPEWSVPFERLARLVGERRPEARVLAAYLEQMRPTLDEAIASLVAVGAMQIAVAPVFLAPGGHVKRDLAQAVAALRSRYPAVTVRLLPTIGESEALLGAMADWIANEGVERRH